MRRMLFVVFMVILGAFLIVFFYMRKKEGKTTPELMTLSKEDVDKGKPIAIASEEEFYKVLKSNTIVLVDFYSNRCPPCKMVKPIIYEIAKEYMGRIAVATVNINNFGDLAVEYEVEYIPDVKIFKGGSIEETLVGLKQKEEYTKIIDRLLQNEN